MDVVGTVLAVLSFLALFFIVMPAIADDAIVQMPGLPDVTEPNPEREAQRQDVQDAVRLGFIMSASVLISAAVYRFWSWIAILLF